MRHRSALSLLKWIVPALALGLGTSSARAQAVFDDQDWTIDRGRINVNNNYNVDVAWRQGYNNFLGSDAAHTTNNPEHARLRWVWPTTLDLDANLLSGAFYVDNPYPGFVKSTLSNGQQANDALAFGFPNGYSLDGSPGSWIILNPANRVFEGGFSYGTDPSIAYDFDYGAAAPTEETFYNQGTAAPIAQLESLPYVPAPLYANIQQQLVNLTTGNKALPTAVWTIGTNYSIPNPDGTTTQQVVPAGNYSVDIWSPGDGTIDDNNIFRPNLFHVFVRVSWNNTVKNNNTINRGTAVAGAGGIDDPQYSRIYMVDMTGAPGWRHIAPSGSSSTVTPLNPSAFPFDGTHANQITVTLYTITPDNIFDTNLYGNPPLATADAVRFLPISTLNPNPNLYNPATSNLAVISPSGSIQAPTVGSNKIAFKTKDPSLNQNVYYVARQEQVLNPIYYPPPTVTPVPPDPTQTTLTPTNDNDAVLSVPVFYCLNNTDEALFDVNGNYLSTNPSKQRVRWRYVAWPDAGDGSVLSSPLIANVRCRDGKSRNMVYFATTTSDGSFGHIYALDPLGNNPYDATVATADPGDLSTRTTNAYWIYPSYRPLLSVTDANGVLHQAANEPTQAPAEWEDPNFTLPTTLTGGLGRDLGVGTRHYPGFTFGQDQPLAANGNEIYDGDIKQTTAAAQPYVTRSDTRLTMPGMAWAPTLIDDPDNPTGPQILIVGGKSYNSASETIGGRLYAFDAGGRGDFGKVTDANKVVHAAAGTTQRLWTWPHFGADAFHKLYTAATYATQKFTIQDDLPVGYFAGSPVYDTTYPTATGVNGHANLIPIMVGSGDGHVYALRPIHDVLTGVSNNIAYYENREEWVYPDPTVDAGAGLGAAPSTLAFLHTTSGKDLLYFTDDGDDGLNARVYCINEHPKVAGSQTDYYVNTLYWVWPFASNPPLADSNNAATDPLYPGFGPSAPVAVRRADVNNAYSIINSAAGRAALAIPYDMIYVVQNDGIVSGLQADPGKNGGATNLFSQAPPVTDTTTVTPMVSLLEPLTTDGLFDYDTGLNGNIGAAGVYSVALPSVVFSDDTGGIYGFGLNSVWDGTPGATDPNPNGGANTVLPADWAYFGSGDPSDGRFAPATLTHAYLTEGDEHGQMYAYSLGTGPNGLGETVGKGEPSQNGEDLVDIDVRVLDYYLHDDWINFMAGINDTPQPPHNKFESPAVVGGNAQTQQAPATLTKAIDPAQGLALDWGETVYVSAWGVYHAQPQQNLLPKQTSWGLNAPTITVSFTIQQPGGTTPSTVTVPAVMNVGTQLWPGDRGFPVGLYPQLSIYGTDEFGNDQLLQGGQTGNNNEFVYVWVAKTKFTINPDQNHPYAPGVSGIRISAQAKITQNVQQTGGTAQQLAYVTQRFFAGQRDATGKATPSHFQTSPNDVAALGPVRPVYIANPLALSTRAYTPNGNGIQDQTGQAQHNIIGWAGAVDDPARPLNDPREVLGNGATLGIPYQPGVNNQPPPAAPQYKSLFAPLEMGSPGDDVEYKGVDAAGNQVLALYALDRSALTLANPATKSLKFQVLMPSLHWHGGVTSVMNPLPWDLLPDDQHDTLDYPAVSASQAKILMADGVTDVTKTTGSLQPPLPGNANDPIGTRIPVPTPLDLHITLPPYQPANVNRGPVQIGNHTFGSAMVDDANVLQSTVLGPISTSNGNTPTQAQSGAFPAAGYLAQGIQVAVQLPGQIINRPPAFNGYMIGRRNEIWRQFIGGLCVAPKYQLTVAEQTLDFGKLPAGAGYTDNDGSQYGYRLPFAPSGTKPYQNITSPWDSDQLLGEFFRPFTLVSQSNVNMVNLRVNKLYGILGGTINQGSLTSNPNSATTIIGNRLVSNEVSDLLTPPILGVPFGLPGSKAPGNPLGIGNIGFVSSLDGNSDPNNANSAFNNTSEAARNLYPIVDPTIDGNAISQVTTLFNDGLLLDNNWSLGMPRATLHKPRVGDSAGTTETIPDTPHDFISDALQLQGSFTPKQPEVGIAVPIGTSVGTYTGAIVPYEDEQPIQWLEWLRSSKPNNAPSEVGSALGNNDGVFNLNANGAALEPYASGSGPGGMGTAVRLTVREGQLTEGTYAGDLSQIDLLDPLAQFNIGKDSRKPTIMPGFNMLPAVFQAMEGNANALASDLFVYWTTNRQGANSPYVQNGAPLPNSPVGLGISATIVPYQQFKDPVKGTTFYLGGSNFAKPGSGSLSNPTSLDPLVSAQWWMSPTLYPGYDGAGQPLNYTTLFPSIGDGTLPGTPVPNTVKYYAPAVASANSITGRGTSFTYNLVDPEGYLFFTGQVDKQQSLATASTQSGVQTESRLFWDALNSSGNPNGVPAGEPNSLLDAPGVPKLSPKPLLVKMGNDPSRNGIPEQKMLYLFWTSGSQGRTTLYYNVNAYHLTGKTAEINGLNAPITQFGWGADPNNPIDPTNPNDPRLGDQKLPVPDALAWQSDPYPVFRRVVAQNPFSGNTNDFRVFDAVDLYYTGVIKNRQTVEILMTRYGIYRGELLGPANTKPTGLKVGQLFPLQLPTVVSETMARAGGADSNGHPAGTDTFQARDMSWYTGTPGQILIQLEEPNGNIYNLNGDPNNPGKLQTGQFDPASGLIYYNAVATNPNNGQVVTGAGGRPIFGGGKMIVDARAGTVRFQDILPGANNAVLATYTPQVMRLSTSRDDSNLIVTDGFGNFNNPVAATFMPHPTTETPGSNSAPMVVMDRSANLRDELTNPPVVFDKTAVPMPTDRLWVLYRKSDLSGSVKSTLYYKAMRLMARLPTPVALRQVGQNGARQIASVIVKGNVGPYEVDYLRGRIYFTEADEGRIITVEYAHPNAQGNPVGSGLLTYRVAWGDEVSITGSTPDETTSEAALPMDQSVNEGQVTAFKDLFLDRLWVFWSSTRGGTTDLFYETLAPQFYPSDPNQQ